MQVVLHLFIIFILFFNWWSLFLFFFLLLALYPTHSESLQCHYADSSVFSRASSLLTSLINLSWITVLGKWRIKHDCISCINVQIWDNCTDARFPTLQDEPWLCHVFSISYYFYLDDFNNVLWGNRSVSCVDVASECTGLYLTSVSII